jgi:hypothetical protein
MGSGGQRHGIFSNGTIYFTCRIFEKSVCTHLTTRAYHSSVRIPHPTRDVKEKQWTNTKNYAFVWGGLTLRQSRATDGGAP